MMTPEQLESARQLQQAVTAAWAACQQAWADAGFQTPCLDPAYLAARDRLAKLQAGA